MRTYPTNRCRRGFTTIELGFVVVIIVIFIIILTPFIRNIRAKKDIIACEETLQEIGSGLKLYASEHQGKFPLTLNELLEGGYVENERALNYHYTTEYTISSPSDTVILFDKEGSHKAGRHVLYINGDIVWEEK